jgi:GntR family transcriptional repressor for pyruvate dehydrogenase complex
VTVVPRHFDRVDALRSPKLTAVVADMLRRKIISGELNEGDNLPNEPELMKQLGVSRPTLREALRVLESESLIRPRRGSRTGAEVCAPSVELSARYMGFVLQHSGVTIEDVLKARGLVEPPLAGLVAASRSAKAVAALRDALKDEGAVVDDRVAFGEASIMFHERVAELAGIDSLTLYVRQLNWVLAKLTREVESNPERGASGNPRAHRSHARFVSIVEAGIAEDAEKFWRAHVTESSRELIRHHVGGGKVIDLFQ